jgi:hypothetical protein
MTDCSSESIRIRVLESASVKYHTGCTNSIGKCEALISAHRPEDPACIMSHIGSSLFCMRRAQNFLTPNVLKTLYFAFIQSHLNYCPIILSSISQQNFNQIKLIQKKAIRIITRSSYTAHTEPLFAQLQILPNELILKQAKLLFMHSIEYNYAPPSFRGIWTKNYVN